LYLHSRSESPILSLAIVNNAGVILNSYEWYRGAYHDLLETLG
jgi:predicted RNA polymerase sigma factor